MNELFNATNNLLNGTACLFNDNYAISITLEIAFINIVLILVLYFIQKYYF